MTDPRVSVRLRVLATIVMFMFAALVTRLWFLQVLAAEEYRVDALNNAVRTIELPAPRGRILDANGELLVRNRLSRIVTINRTEAGDDLERVIHKLAHLLGMRNRFLAERLTTAGQRYYSYQPVPVAFDVPKKIIYWIAEHQNELPGVWWANVPVREYPFRRLAAHILGTLGEISKKQLRDPAFAGHEAGDIVGQTGLEREYERDLAGSPGVIKYRVNSADENLGVIGRDQPDPGKDLQLTLDIGTQRIAEDALREGIMHARTVTEEGSGLLAATGGAVVVMDPRTGGIKAMASFPTFDPSELVRGMTAEEYQHRFGEAKHYPLLDRAIQGQYPPGSTYKPFVALSAIRRGLMAVGGSYDCPSSWEPPPPNPLDEHFDNWSSADFGFISLAQALYDSCDTVFYPLGYEYWQRWYPTQEADQPALPLQQDLRASGFGEETGIDIPFEGGGRVPDPVWKRTYHRKYPESFPDGETFPADFILMTIGQGDTLVTPLQLAVAYAGIANDGEMCWPHVVDRVLFPDGKLDHRIRPKCGRARSMPFPVAAVRYVREALTQVPAQGTAASAFTNFPLSQVSVAAKTGTAEIDYPPGTDDYSWFAAITDDGTEEYVVVALVEQGGHGSTTAAPIVRRIIEGLYGLEPSGFIRGAVTD